MDETSLSLLDDLSLYPSLDAAGRRRAIERTNWLKTAAAIQCAELLHEFLELPDEELRGGDPFLAAVFTNFTQARRHSRGPASAPWIDEQVPQFAIDLHQRLPATSQARAAILAMLAMGGTRQELALLVDQLVSAPPQGDVDIVATLAPLFQFPDYDVTIVFPKLLAALAHSSLAAAVLDLANFLTRRGLVKQHPAYEHRAELMRLLGELTQRMHLLEEHPEQAARSPQELARTVAHGVSLAVSLCDALAQIGDPAAIAKLNQTLEIRHRRVRTEAAAALAKLGEEHGKEELVKLASEPIARLRVLTYAEELGLLEKLEPEYQSPQARAEAELAAWLAEPTQFGVPPAECEIVDERKQFWPGYETPVDCFLIRFTYKFNTAQGPATFSNIGITGPLVRTATADLCDLGPDDIYALFAGWQAEHEDIFEVDATLLSESQRIELARLERRLRDAGYDAIRPVSLCYFFGEKSLVARVKRDGVEGTALTDSEDILFFPATHGPRSLGPPELTCLYRGRRLLRQFNA